MDEARPREAQAQHERREAVAETIEHARWMPARATTARMDLAATVLAALLTIAPHARQRPPSGWEETREVYESRLRDIAEDIAAASDGSRERAVKLIGVAFHESGFAADVDAGRCAEVPRGRCDGGRAASLWQLQDADAVKMMVFKLDRGAAAREAIRRIERSERACAGNATNERLAVYAGGKCSLLSARAAARGLWASVERARRVMR